MRLTCDRNSLVDKLNTLARGVSTRSALPVLSGILLQAKEGRLDLYSTDMEISIKASLLTTVERNGEVVVPARLFTDVVKNLSAEEVVLELKDGKTVEVASGKARFSLNSWVASDFPQVSAFDTSGGFTVGRDPFVETLNKVGRAASRDETRPILTGVLVTIAGGMLKMVATDSYRLSVKETPLGGGSQQEVEAIVPVKALSEVARLAASMGEGDIEVAVSENQALFKVADAHGDVWIASRLIDGQFPNYRQLVPESFDHTISLGKEEFLAAARRISLLAQKNAPLRLGFAPGRLTVPRRHTGRGPSRRRARDRVQRRGVRDRLQRRLPGRRHRQCGRRAGDAEVHQPAAPWPGDGTGRELPLLDHADPSQQLNDVGIDGPLPLGAFLKLAGAVASGGAAKVSIQRGDVTVNGAVETRRGHAVVPGDVVSVGGKEYRACSCPR